LLHVFNARQSESGYSGWRHIYQADHFGAEVSALLRDLNSDECIDAIRVLVWRDRTTEGLAAVIRHELEHAVQNEAHGQSVERLYHLALQVLAVRVNGLPGNGFLYTIIPNELDANAAAAIFVRTRYGRERIIELLEARDEDSAAFRSLVGPAPVDTLPERLLAAQQGFAFWQLLDDSWPGSGAVWRELVDQSGLMLPR
jgi:hypothetical protein